MSKVLIIGGGAAGMMAAVAAGENGHDVWLYEKNEQLQEIADQNKLVWKTE